MAKTKLTEITRTQARKYGAKRGLNLAEANKFSFFVSLREKGVSKKLALQMAKRLIIAKTTR